MVALVDGGWERAFVFATNRHTYPAGFCRRTVMQDIRDRFGLYATRQPRLRLVMYKFLCRFLHSSSGQVAIARPFCLRIYVGG